MVRETAVRKVRKVRQTPKVVFRKTDREIPQAIRKQHRNFLINPERDFPTRNPNYTLIHVPIRTATVPDPRFQETTKIRVDFARTA